MALGQPNVDEMLRSMTAQQLQEWMVFFGLERPGPDRLDSLFASVVQAISNIRWRPRRMAPYTLDECRLLFGDAEQTKRVTDWREMKAIMRAALSSEG